MRLKTFILKNYRCYQEKTEINFKELAAIIGKNDIGKSAVFEGIDAFFNDTIEQSDLSVSEKSNSIELTCVFENIPENIILDTSEPTSPSEEGMLNSDGCLQIKKVITFGARKTVFTYLIANHLEDEDVKDLLRKKRQVLKQHAINLGVDLSNVNQNKNPPLRKAIREHVGGSYAIQELKVDGGLTSEDNLKTIWSSLKKTLPIFSLFKSDKPFDDKDSDIKNPLQAAINEALNLTEVQKLLEKVEKKVKDFSTDIADRTIKKLENFDSNLSERLQSDFNKSPNYNRIFDLTLMNENGIPLNKRGSGIRRLVVLSFFQAQAEKRKLEQDAPSIIYAIEEPETSQHPNHQKMIIESLCDLGSEENVQVLFTTHSANLVNDIPIGSLIHLCSNDNKLEIEYGEDNNGQKNDDVIGRIIDTLGVLPNPSDKIKVLVYLEGNNDVLALKRYSEIINSHDRTIINLMDVDSVAYVITGGSSLTHYINEKYLDGLGKPALHLYDSDVQDYVDKVREINERNDPRLSAFNTVKRELENYLHQDAIEEAHTASNQNGVKIPTIEDDTDVPAETAKFVCELNGGDWESLKEEKKDKKISKKKKFLNTQAVDKMSIQRIKDRGGYDEMCEWFKQIERLSTLD